MKTLLTYSLTFLCLASMAQISSTKDKSYHQAPISEVFDDLKSGSDITFSYPSIWADSTKFTGRLDITNPHDAISILSESLGVSFYYEHPTVYWTGNHQVLSDFALTHVPNQQRKETISTGMIFEREYKDFGAQNLNNDIIIEIGKNKPSTGDRISLAGYITDAESGTPVEGALVYIESPFIGTSTDTSGFYSLQIPKGKHTLRFQSLDMKDSYRNVVAFGDGRLDHTMDIDVIALRSVTVNADRDRNIENAVMGVTRIDMKEAKNVPILLGEKDIVKIATTTSGVQSIGEGAAGINIRGGKADQNLFLLDGSTVYNTSHFFGFFSVFNSETIGSMDVFKSAIPAQYGGRLSSVLDIKTKSPNRERLTFSGGIGPITSSLQLETPLFNSNTSAMIGGRATYSDFVLNRVTKSPLGNNRASFYDLIGKIEHDFSENSKLSITGYHSFDSFQLTADSLLSYSDFSYTNTNVSTRYFHRLNSRLEANFTGSFVDYKYNIGYDILPAQAFDIAFGVKELSGLADFQYFHTNILTHSFGLMSKNYQVNPGIKSPLGNESLVELDGIEQEQANESAFYYSLQVDPSDKWSFIGGLRYSMFNATGPRSTVSYQGVEKRAERRNESIWHANGESIQRYQGLEWRLSGRHKLSETSSLKMSINRTRQYIHLLINAASISPNDIWRLSSEHIRPQVSDQISFGYYKNLYRKSIYEFSAEVYYKKLQDMLDFKVGSNLQFNHHIETDVLQGDGHAYGLELSVSKKKGWFSGYMNYTLSRSIIRLNGDAPSEIINDGAYFPTNYDKPHYLNLVTNYKFTRRYSMSLNMIYATGRPITYPVGKWSYKGSENIYYSDRNAFRLPDYFRVDIGLNVEGSHKIKKLAHSFWTFSIYNLLGRDNIYSIFFTVEDSDVKGYQMTIFPDPIPTITYNFKF